MSRVLSHAEIAIRHFRQSPAVTLPPRYPHRLALLNRRVVCDLLGFDEEACVGVRRLAAKRCAEPSVHGGKAKPRCAALVI